MSDKLYVLKREYVHRMEDQLVIWMALANGQSEILTSAPTLHTRTAMAVAEMLLPHAEFTVVAPGELGKGKGPWRIVCQGAGVAAGA